MSKICSCFGKVKNIKKDGLEESLFVLFEQLIKEQGFDTFCFGGIGEFDEMCFKVIKKLQSEYGRIKTVLAKPKLKFSTEAFDDDFEKRFDESVMVGSNEQYDRFPILARNFEIAKASSFIVFFAHENGRGNETKILNFAKEQNIPFINFY